MYRFAGSFARANCARNVLRCPYPTLSAGVSSKAGGMSKQLEKKDFGPDGFKWLTLKRIVVCLRR